MWLIIPRFQSASSERLSDDCNLESVDLDNVTFLIGLNRLLYLGFKRSQVVSQANSGVCLGLVASNLEEDTFRVHQRLVDHLLEN